MGMWMVNVGYNKQSYASFGNLNIRGFGLPSCGTGVTDPTSTKPNPNPSKPSTASAFLSKPADRPTGLENLLPHTSISNIVGSGLFSTGTHPRAAAVTASRWATSGSRNAKKGLTSFVALNSQPLHVQHVSKYKFPSD